MQASCSGELQNEGQSRDDGGVKRGWLHYDLHTSYRANEPRDEPILCSLAALDFDRYLDIPLRKFIFSNCIAMKGGRNMRRRENFIGKAGIYICRCMFFCRASSLSPLTSSIPIQRETSYPVVGSKYAV